MGYWRMVSVRTLILSLVIGAGAAAQNPATQAYAFTGGSVNPPGGVIAGKFVLLDAGAIRPGVVPDCSGNAEWNLLAFAGGAGYGTVRLADGRQGDVVIGLNGQPRVYGKCQGTAAVGPTRLELMATSFANIPGTLGDFIKIHFDDAPPAQPVLRMPLLDILPPGARISTASQFSFGSLLMGPNIPLAMNGTITCLAKLKSFDDDATTSACGNGGIQSSTVPSIGASNGIVNGASFLSGIASNTWVTIRGTNLANTTRGWEARDFAGSALPTQLDGVQVKINGRSAYVAYVSPGQLNVLAPDDSTLGTVPVEVITAAGTSARASANKQLVAPAFFVLEPQGGRYLVAQNSNTFELIAPTGLFGGNAVTRPAVAGEALTFYATGLGATNPAHPAGQIVTTPVPAGDAAVALWVGETMAGFIPQLSVR